MLSVIFESMWVWYLAGVALWAFVGALVAGAQRLPVGVGAAAGGVFWFVGVVVVLVVGLARPRGRSGAPAPTSFPAPISFPVQTSQPFPFAGASSAPYASTPSDPFAAQAAPGPFGSPAPWGTSDGWGWPGQPSERTPAYATAAVPVVPPPGVAPEVLRRRALTGAGIAGGVAMIVSALLPWGSGRVAWNADHAHVGGGVAPISAGPVALAIFITAAVVIAGALLMHRRPGTAWPVLAAVVTTWWFCLVLEWLLIESSLTSVGAAADNLSGDTASASLSTAPGVWIMLVGCIAVYAWCAVASLPLLRQDARVQSAPATPAFGI